MSFPLRYRCHTAVALPAESTRNNGDSSPILTTSETFTGRDQPEAALAGDATKPAAKQPAMVKHRNHESLTLPSLRSGGAKPGASSPSGTNVTPRGRGRPRGVRPLLRGRLRLIRARLRGGSRPGCGSRTTPGRGRVLPRR